MCQELAAVWSDLTRVLETRRPEEVEIFVPAQNRKEKKWRIFVDVADPKDEKRERKVSLGKPTTREVAVGGARGAFQLTPRHVTLDGEEHVCHTGNTLYLSELVELLEKGAGIKWSAADMAALAAAPVCMPGSSIQARDWLRDILGDGMFDSFASLYPTARGRYTCWCQVRRCRLVALAICPPAPPGASPALRHACCVALAHAWAPRQYTNERYRNEGSRIDYIIADEPLLPAAARGAGLYVPAGLEAPEPEAESAQAALAAATAAGLWVPAPFEGGGIQEGSRRAFESEFRPPCSGMLYTAPVFSDHIGVTLLLDGYVPGCAPEGALKSKEAARQTRDTQPHKQQATLASFFGKGVKSSAQDDKEHQARPAAASLDSTAAAAAAAAADAAAGDASGPLPPAFASTGMKRPAAASGVLLEEAGGAAGSKIQRSDTTPVVEAGELEPGGSTGGAERGIARFFTKAGREAREAELTPKIVSLALPFASLFSGLRGRGVYPRVFLVLACLAVLLTGRLFAPTLSRGIQGNCPRASVAIRTARGSGRQRAVLRLPLIYCGAACRCRKKRRRRVARWTTGSRKHERQRPV